MHIHIINGPNINLLGKREVDVYGNQSFETYFKATQQQFAQIKLTHFQSNVEGEIINELQRVGYSVDGIIINAAGYTHTSIAIADAMAAIPSPIIEVHISNIYAREEFRKTSYTSGKAKGVITGLGLEGYTLAIQWFLQQHK